jgi:hypothetical protein
MLVSRNASVGISMADIISEFPHPLYMFPYGADKCQCPISCLKCEPLVCMMVFNELDPVLSDPPFSEVLPSYLWLRMIFRLQWGSLYVQCRRKRHRGELSIFCFFGSDMYDWAPFSTVVQKFTGSFHVWRLFHGCPQISALCSAVSIGGMLTRGASLRFGSGTYSMVEFHGSTGDVLLLCAAYCDKPLIL